MTIFILFIVYLSFDTVLSPIGMLTSLILISGKSENADGLNLLAIGRNRWNVKGRVLVTMEMRFDFTVFEEKINFHFR